MNNTDKRIKLLIADDHQILADGLKSMLQGVDWIEIVGIVNNGWQVIEFVNENEVDMVILDFQMPLLNGIETTIKIRRNNSKLKILMLTFKEDAEAIKSAIHSGVNGYVMKNIPKEGLERAISRVMEGDRFFSDDVILKLSEIPNPVNANGKSSVNDKIVLSEREKEVLRFIIKEFTNPEIASELNLAVSTITTHRQNIYTKAGVKTAIGLLKWALKNGFITNNDIEDF